VGGRYEEPRYNNQRNIVMTFPEFQCKYVSASEAGDYFQVFFGEIEEESEAAYLLVQRQFEFPDHGECYVETNDLDFCGHFVIHRAQLTRNRFRISYGDGPRKHVTVSFVASDRDFAEAERILQVIIPDP
jgi:hypothetical protein